MGGNQASGVTRSLYNTASLVLTAKAPWHLGDPLHATTAVEVSPYPRSTVCSSSSAWMRAQFPALFLEIWQGPVES